MNKQTDISLATLHAPTRHDSGPKHVTGTAEYIDDMIEPVGTMHAYLGLSTRPHAEILGMNLDAVVSALDEITRGLHETGDDLLDLAQRYGVRDLAGMGRARGARGPHRHA